MNKELQTAIDAAASIENNHYVVFDFDNTCIVNDITEACLAYASEHNLFKVKLPYIEEVLGEEKYNEYIFKRYFELLRLGEVKEAYSLVSQAWKDFSEEDMEGLTNEVIEREGSDITTRSLFGITIERGLKARESVRDLLQYFVTKNIPIWVVSASVEPFAQTAFGHFFPEIPVKLIGVQTVQENGFFTEKIQEPMPMYEGKVARIKDTIDKNKPPLLVVGDSLNDKPMLEYAQIAVVVGNNPALSKVAKENGWFTMD